MRVSAKLRGARISPQKARLMADNIRGVNIERALDLLTFSPQKSAKLFKKVLESAIANAEHNHGADIDALNIAEVFVDEGPILKRFIPRAKGRSSSIFKRSSHITVILEERG